MQCTQGHAPAYEELLRDEVGKSLELLLKHFRDDGTAVTNQSDNDTLGEEMVKWKTWRKDPALAQWFGDAKRNFRDEFDSDDAAQGHSGYAPARVA